MTDVETVQNYMRGILSRGELERVLRAGSHSRELRSQIRVLLALDDRLTSAFKTLPFSPGAPLKLRAAISQPASRISEETPLFFGEEDLEERLKSLGSLPVRPGAAVELAEQLRFWNQRDVRAAGKNLDNENPE